MFHWDILTTTTSKWIVGGKGRLQEMLFSPEVKYNIWCEALKDYCHFTFGCICSCLFYLCFYPPNPLHQNTQTHGHTHSSETSGTSYPLETGVWTRAEKDFSQCMDFSVQVLQMTIIPLKEATAHFKEEPELCSTSSALFVLNQKAKTHKQMRSKGTFLQEEL